MGVTFALFVQVTVLLGLIIRSNSEQIENEESIDTSRRKNEVSEVIALYDPKMRLIFYKDPTLPACFFQKDIDLRHFQNQNIILDGKPSNESKIMSEFQKVFCSNLRLFKMEPNPVNEPNRRRVHRNRRRRNTRQNYSPDSSRGNNGQQSYYFPGSQTQIEGNVAGKGYFSGQAQSQYSGLSQSQLQLGGIGITGSMSSVAGGSQSALRLGVRSGSGQISSSGSGPSASELQLILGEANQESRARATVMQQQYQTGTHQQGSSYTSEAGQQFLNQGTRRGQQDSRDFTGQRQNIGDYQQQYSSTDDRTQQHQQQPRQSFPTDDRTQQQPRQYSPTDDRTQQQPRQYSPTDDRTQQHQQQSRQSSPTDDRTQQQPRQYSPTDDRTQQQPRQYSPTDDRTQQHQQQPRQSSPTDDRTQQHQQPRQYSTSQDHQNGYTSYQDRTNQQTHSQGHARSGYADYDQPQFSQQPTEAHPARRVQHARVDDSSQNGNYAQDQQQQPLHRTQGIPITDSALMSNQHQTDRSDVGRGTTDIRHRGLTDFGQRGSTDMGRGLTDVGRGTTDVGQGSTGIGHRGTTDIGQRSPGLVYRGSTDIGRGTSNIGQGSSDIGYRGTTEIGRGRADREQGSTSIGHRGSTDIGHGTTDVGQRSPDIVYRGSTDIGRGTTNLVDQTRSYVQPPLQPLPRGREGNYGNGLLAGQFQSQTVSIGNIQPQQSSTTYGNGQTRPIQSGIANGQRNGQDTYPHARSPHTPTPIATTYSDDSKTAGQTHEQQPMRQNGGADPRLPQYGFRVQETQALDTSTQQPTIQNGHTIPVQRPLSLPTHTSFSQQQQITQQSTQPQNGFRYYQPAQQLGVNGHQVPRNGINVQDSTQGDLPMASYPTTNGRRVYQRRTVTYYPAKGMSNVQQPHYVQQTLAGSSPQTQPVPDTMVGEPHYSAAGDPNSGCQIITFTCTVIFENNGKSKLCRPKPTGGNGQSNICCC